MRPTDLTALEWPPQAAADACRALAAAAGFPRPDRDVDGRGPSLTGGGPLQPAEEIRQLAEEVGQGRWEAELIDLPGADLVPLLRVSAPMLIRCPGRAGLLAVVRAGAATTAVLMPGRAVGRCACPPRPWRRR